MTLYLYVHSSAVIRRLSGWMSPTRQVTVTPPQTVPRLSPAHQLFLLPHWQLPSSSRNSFLSKMPESSGLYNAASTGLKKFSRSCPDYFHLISASLPFSPVDFTSNSDLQGTPRRGRSSQFCSWPNVHFHWDIRVLENSLLPVAYNSRNPHIFSSLSPSRMECVHGMTKSHNTHRAIGSSKTQNTFHDVHLRGR